MRLQIILYLNFSINVRLELCWNFAKVFSLTHNFKSLSMLEFPFEWQMYGIDMILTNNLIIEAWKSSTNNNDK